MRKYKNKYFTETKKRIRDYRTNNQNSTKIQKLYDEAVDNALSDIRRMTNGDEREKIIQYVLMRGHSIESASQQYHYSYSTVIHWTSDFVTAVMKYVGT